MLPEQNLNLKKSSPSVIAEMPTQHGGRKQQWRCLDPDGGSASPPTHE